MNHDRDEEHTNLPTLLTIPTTFQRFQRKEGFDQEAFLDKRERTNQLSHVIELRFTLFIGQNFGEIMTKMVNLNGFITQFVGG